MSKRDKAKSAAVKVFREKVSSLINDTMARKCVDLPELESLCDFESGDLCMLLSKPPIAKLAKVFFELGYELNISAVPISRERLEELARAR